MFPSKLHTLKSPLISERNEFVADPVAAVKVIRGSSSLRETPSRADAAATSRSAATRSGRLATKSAGKPPGTVDVSNGNEGGISITACA